MDTVPSYNSNSGAERTISEALSNIARHAEASQVWVTVKLIPKGDQNWLSIEIRDDGLGFEPETAIGNTGHYGLLGMRERSRLAGGRFEISKEPGKGTRVDLQIPINSTQGHGSTSRDES